jgi:hypothetical protein
MKYLLLSTFTIFIISCSTSPAINQEKVSPEDTERKKIVIDSIIADAKESASKKIIDRAYDSQEDCPLKIVKYWLTHNSINTPEANITYKNVSNKTIDGIKVGVACYNNFDEPVNSGFNNIFAGIDQDRLRPGRQNTATWTMSLYDNTTKIKPFIREVHFTDGSRWEIPND